MTYAYQANTPKPAALLGALAIPLGAGVLLATSLVVTVFPSAPDDRVEGFTIKVDPIDPPPPPPETKPSETAIDTPVQNTRLPDIVIPQPDFTLIPGPAISTGEFTLPDIVIEAPASGAGSMPATSISAAAIAAVPNGNPGSWIRESDYRTRWINEGLSGVAQFSLSISASGRVTDCTITRSTGHAVLDGATCRLLERRAKFKPARNGAGGKIEGTYNSSISWEIPN